MTEILEFIIIVILALTALRALSATVRRMVLLVKLSVLSRDTGATLRIHSFPFLSFFRLSRTPEITLRTENTVYLIRTYNGGGIGKVVHFAAEGFTVRFSRLRTASYKLVKRQNAGGGNMMARGGFGVGVKVKLLPKLEVPREIESSDYRIVKVLIFNPAAGDVSYVTEERTSINVAYTGDRVYDDLIFTATTFVNHVDREVRRRRELAAHR